MAQGPTWWCILVLATTLVIFARGWYNSPIRDSVTKGNSDNHLLSLVARLRMTREMDAGNEAFYLAVTSDKLIVVLLSEYTKREGGEGIPGAGSRPPSTSSVTSGCWTGEGTSGATGYQQRRGSLQLWQFLVALLDDPSNNSCIAWTGRGMEFKLVEPEEVSCRTEGSWTCS